MAGAPVSYGAFTNPASILAPDLSVQQQQIDRANALVQALRQQALEPIEVRSGAISPWQGVAKLAQAISASIQQRRADKQQKALNEAYSDKIGPLFGRGNQGQPGGQMSLGGVSTMGADGNTAPAMPQPAPPQPAPDMGNLGPVPQGATSVAQAFPDMTPQEAVAPQAPPQQRPMPAPQQRGPLSLTGNPQQDMAMYAMDPGEYMKGVVAANSPTDIRKSLIQMGIDPDSGMGRSLQQQAFFKDHQYIPPVNARGNSWTLDPVTGKRTYNAALPEGSMPLFDENGNLAGVKLLDGTTQAIAALEGSKTAAAAANKPITGYDQNGNPVFTNEYAAAHGGNGGTIRPGPPLGAVSAANTAGEASAKDAQAISDAAADVPNRKFALHQMMVLLADPKTVLGPGSESVAKLNGFLGTLSQAAGIPFDPKIATNAAEFNKWVSQYTARSAQELGLAGSDARLAIAVHANPNGQMPPQALRSLVPTLDGIEDAKAGMNRAWQAYQQQPGHTLGMGVQQFRATWNQYYDPRIYTWLAQGGPNAVVAHIKSDLNQQDAASMLRKYRWLKQNGALPQ